MKLSDVVISDDKTQLDRDLIFQFIHDSYWGEGIPRDIFEASLDHSVCFGAYVHDQQIGFARVITDNATFAYLADVFVLGEFNGKGVAQKMVDVILEDPRFLHVRRFLLATRDAHSLYEKFGFSVLSEDDRTKFMQVRRVRSYKETFASE